jgi:RNA polymerase sigma-70 factor, ECF subfamily
MHLQVKAIDETLNDLMSSDNIEDGLINTELVHIIVALTDTLTPKQKIVFTLRDLEGLEVDEVSQITGLSAKQIKSNLFLARQAIRNKLGRQ